MSGSRKDNFSMILDQLIFILFRKPPVAALIGIIILHTRFRAGSRFSGIRIQIRDIRFIIKTQRIQTAFLICKIRSGITIICITNIQEGIGKMCISALPNHK